MGFTIGFKWSHEDSRIGIEKTQCQGGKGLAQESSGRDYFQNQCGFRDRYSHHSLPEASFLIFFWLLLFFLPILHISGPLCHRSPSGPHSACRIFKLQHQHPTGNDPLRFLVPIHQSKNQIGPAHHCAHFDQSNQLWPRRNWIKWLKKVFFNCYWGIKGFTWVISLYSVISRADNITSLKHFLFLSSRNHPELYIHFFKNLKKIFMGFYISAQNHHVPLDHCLVH